MESRDNDGEKNGSRYDLCEFSPASFTWKIRQLWLWRLTRFIGSDNSTSVQPLSSASRRPNHSARLLIHHPLLSLPPFTPFSVPPKPTVSPSPSCPYPPILDNLDSSPYIGKKKAIDRVYCMHLALHSYDTALFTTRIYTEERGRSNQGVSFPPRILASNSPRDIDRYSQTAFNFPPTPARESPSAGQSADPHRTDRRRPPLHRDLSLHSAPA